MLGHVYNLIIKIKPTNSTPLWYTRVVDQLIGVYRSGMELAEDCACITDTEHKIKTLIDNHNYT